MGIKQSTYIDGETLSGLKSYVYYSCRYKKNDLDVVINYSLDNYIEIEGSIDGKTVKMYSCGPTVYSEAHVGNMRAYIFMDTLRKVLDGLNLGYVEKITSQVFGKWITIGI